MSDYEYIAEAIDYIIADKQATIEDVLKDVLEYLGLSHYDDFQKLLTRWTGRAGTSPERFLQTLTKKHTKALSSESMEVNNESGLSSSGRLSVNLEAITPGEYKEKVYYAVHDTIFGNAFIAVTGRDIICKLSFAENDSRRIELEEKILELEEKWSSAKIKESKKVTKRVINSIFSKTDTQQSFSIYVKNTNYVKDTNFHHIDVWKALLNNTPEGTVTTYDQLANSIGSPKAKQAVSQALRANPVAFLIPCHRVIKSSGEIGESPLLGNIRKRSILSWEALRK